MEREPSSLQEAIVYFADPANIGTPHLGFLSGLPSSYHENYQLFQAINRFTGGVTVNHHPVSWFNQRLTLGVDGGNEDSEELGGVHHDLSFFFDTDADSGYKVVDTRDTRIFTSSYVGNLILPVSGTVRSTTSLGGDIIKRDGKFFNGFGADFPAPGLSSLSSTTARQQTIESDTLDNTVGVFGQEEVAWRDRLFLTAGVRLDNNSAFGKQFRNVFYPKFSASWVLSEEPFFHLPDVTTLKLRAVRNVTAAFPDREVSAVIGPSGCGKSTFLRCLNRMHELIPMTRVEGPVRLDGEGVQIGDHSGQHPTASGRRWCGG